MKIFVYLFAIAFLSIMLSISSLASVDANREPGFIAAVSKLLGQNAKNLLTDSFRFEGINKFGLKTSESQSIAKKMLNRNQMDDSTFITIMNVLNNPNDQDNQAYENALANFLQKAGILQYVKRVTVGQLQGYWRFIFHLRETEKASAPGANENENFLQQIRALASINPNDLRSTWRREGGQIFKLTNAESAYIISQALMPNLIPTDSESTEIMEFISTNKLPQNTKFTTSQMREHRDKIRDHIRSKIADVDDISSGQHQGKWQIWLKLRSKN